MFTNAEVILCALARRPHLSLLPIGIAVELAIVHTSNADSRCTLVPQ